jgi:hypothetical protein
MSAVKSVNFTHSFDDFAVVVVSCDRFSALWPLFFDRLARHWPDYDGALYLVSNHQQFDHPKVHTLCVGDDRDWSTNLITALSNVAESRILLMLEDAPLDRPVNNAALSRIATEFGQLEFDYLNLKASPRPQNGGPAGYGVYPPGLTYRAALVPCIWKRSVLLDLLVPGENAWQFEIRGSRRSAKYPNFYAVREPALHFLHCVIQGKLDRRAAAALTRTGEIHSLGFPIMTRTAYWRYRLKEVRGYLFGLTPSWLAGRIRTFYFGILLGKPEST